MIVTETYKEDTTMDTFENSEFEYIPETPEETPPTAPQQPYEHPYHGTGAGRKESPYANSPYEAYQPPRQEYRYHPQTEPPVKPKKVKKPRKPIGKKILAAVLALVLIAGSCIATASVMNYRFNNVVDDMVESHVFSIFTFRRFFIFSFQRNCVILGIFPRNFRLFRRI